MWKSSKSESNFTPTVEQQKIIMAAKTGRDLVIQALAGTGKTTTLKLLAESLSNKRGTYIAFNKSIVDEAGTKFPSNVRCRTAHSLAYASVGFKFKDRISDSKRVTMNQISNWLQTPAFGFRHNKANVVFNPDQVSSLVIRSINNFCKSIDESIDEKHIEIPFLMSLDKKKSSEFARIVVPLAKECWVDLNQTSGFLKFNHDYYLKMWQLSSPVINSDFILFDEAQDADPVMLDVIESQKHAQTIFCGDQYQAIYEWRGAKNALSKVSAEETLWLTQSFRFGQAIADEANDILDFLDAPVSVTGFRKVHSKIEKLQNPKAILCRTNAGVIQQVMFELHKKRSVAVLGRTEELVQFAEACRELQSGRRTGHPELAPFETWNEAKEYAEDYPDEAQEIRTMVDLVDRFGVTKLIEALKQVVPELTADVLISTAHKAKGREWESVKLAGDFLHPQDMDEEDLRLAYVSVTRAIKTLDMSEWALIKPLETKIENSIGMLVPDHEVDIVDGNSVIDDEIPERNGMKWSYDEDYSLIENLIDGLSLADIASESGRKISALQARLAKWYLVATYGKDSIEHSETSFSGDGWNDEKLDALFDLWNGDMELHEISSELEAKLFRIATEAIKHDLVEIDHAFLNAVEDYYD